MIGKKRVQFFVKKRRIIGQILAYVCTLAVIIYGKKDLRGMLFAGQVDGKINQIICPPITFL